MDRRLFLRFLALPVITPVARRVQWLETKLRKPTWWVNLCIKASAPFDVTIECDGKEVKRVAFPEGPGNEFIPMWGPKPARVRISVISSGAPMRLYDSDITFRAESSAFSPWRSS